MARRTGIFRNRSFLDYFGMYLSSRSAFQVGNVGLIWLVNAVTHSALDIAIVGIANTASTVIVTLPAGVWIDRVDRKMLLLFSNSVSLICLLLLALMTQISGFNLIFIVALVVVWAAGAELYRSTSYAVVPDFVEVNQLPNANGVAQSGYQIVSSISTIMGGGLIVIAGVELTFVYGALAYGLAALFSGFLFFRFRKLKKTISGTEQGGKRRKMGEEIKEGFRWLLTQRGLLGLSLFALVTNFLFGIPSYFFVIYVTESLKGGPLVFTGILAIVVAGSAVGSLLAGRISRSLAYAGKINLLAFGLGVGILTLVLGLFPITSVALVVSAGIGLGAGFGNTVWLTSSQNLVPLEMRGRYFAIDGLLSFIGGPPSIAVGGIAITLIGITNVFALSGGLIVISSVAFMFMKSLWNLDGRPKELRL